MLGNLLKHISTAGLALLICVAFIPDARAVDVQVKIIFFGDSLVAGYGLANPQKDSLPAKMGEAFRTGKHRKVVTVEGMGVSGETTSSALGRIPYVLAAKPDIVVVALGGNDVLRGIDPDITYNNLDIMLRELQRSGTYVLLTGMKAPPSMGSEFAARFNRIYPKVAELHNVTFYPFLLDGVAGQPQFNQRDGIHPNPAGVDVVVERLYPSLDRMAQKMTTMKKEAARRAIFEEHKRKTRKVR